LVYRVHFCIFVVNMAYKTHGASVIARSEIQ